MYKCSSLSSGPKIETSEVVNLKTASNCIKSQFLDTVRGWIMNLKVKSVWLEALRTTETVFRRVHNRLQQNAAK